MYLPKTPHFSEKVLKNGATFGRFKRLNTLIEHFSGKTGLLLT